MQRRVPKARAAATTTIKSSQRANSRTEERERQIVVLLISQIYARAEAARRTQKKKKRENSLDDEENGDDEEDDAPLSLIELIQASYGVFEQYGIGPPEDAVYHRYLLSLSIDPERDWRKKIRHFDLRRRPMIDHLRFTRGPMTETKASISHDSRINPSSRSSDTYHHAKDAKMRLVSAPSRQSALGVNAVRCRPNLLQNQYDHFSDMLVYPMEEKKQQDEANSGDDDENEITASEVGRVAAFVAAKSDIVRGATSPASSITTTPTRRKQHSRPSSLTTPVKRMLQKYSPGQISRGETTQELTLMNVDTTERDDDEERPTDRTKAMVAAGVNASDNEVDVARSEHDFFHGAKTKVAAFQLLVSAFEGWKALHEIKKLRQKRKRHKLTTNRSTFPPICTHTLFHWVAVTLPQQHEFSTECHAMPTFVLRRISTLPTANLATLRQFTHQFLLWRMRRIFCEWKCDTAILKRFRMKVQAKQRQQTLEIAFRCLQQWRFFTEWHKCLHDRRRWITQRSNRKLMRDYLWKWRQAYTSHRQILWVAQMYANKTLKRIFYEWKIVIQVQQRNEHQYVRFAMKRALRIWRKYLISRENALVLHNLAKKQHRSIQLRRCWQHLRTYTVKRRAMVSLLVGMQQKTDRRLKQMVFTNWKAVNETSQALQERSQRLIQRRGKRQLYECFTLWSDWTERKRSWTVIMMNFTIRSKSALLKKIFCLWKMHFQYRLVLNAEKAVLLKKLAQRRIWKTWRRQVQVCIVMRVMLSQHNCHQRACTFTAWRKFVQTRQIWANLVGIHHGRRELRWKRACWQALIENANLQRVKLDAAERYREQNRRRLVQRYLVKWKWLIGRARNYQRLGQQVKTLVRRQHLLRSCWAVWRRALWLNRTAQLADRQLNAYYQRHMFRLWKHFWQAKQHRRTRLMDIAIQMGQSTLRSCLMQWNRQICAKKQVRSRFKRLHDMSNRYRRQHVWMSWRRAYAGALYRLKQMTSVMDKWQNQRVRNSFQRWKMCWRVRRQHRKLLQSMLSVCKERRLEEYFNAWRRMWQRSNDLKIGTHVASQKLQQWKLQRVLNHWKIVHRQTQTSCMVIGKAIAYWRVTFLETQFRRWHAIAVARKRRKLLTLMANAHYIHCLRRRTISNWSCWSQRQLAMDIKVKLTLKRIRAMRMTRTLRWLQQYSQKMKRLQSIHKFAVLLRGRGTLTTCLSHWKQFIVAKHSYEKELTKNIHCMSRYRVERAIERWRQHVRTRKLIKSTLFSAAQRSKSTLTKQIFANWKMYASHRRVYHALKKKAIVFQVFCLLPQYFRAWKRVVSARKLQKTKLLRARAMWCRQHQWKVFQRWLLFTKRTRQMKFAMLRWQKQTVLTYFAQWKQYKMNRRRRERYNELARRCHHQRILYQVVRSWRQNSRHCRLLRYFTGLWRAQTTHACFDAWQKFVVTHQLARNLLVRWQNSLLLRVFNAWKDRIGHEQTQILAIQQRFIRIWQSEFVATCWTRWRLYCYQQITVKHRLQRRHERVAHKILSSWRIHSIVRKHEHAVRLAVENRTIMWLQQRYWGKWRRKLYVATRVRVMRINLIWKRSISDQHHVFRWWKAYTLRAISIRSFINTRNLKLMQWVFMHGWRGYTTQKHRDKLLMQQLMRIHSSFVSNWLTMQIRERMRVLSICEDKRRTYQRKLLAMVWRVWRSFHQRKMEQHMVVRRLQHQWCSSSTSINTLIFLQLSVTRWKNVHLAKYFDCWAVATQYMYRARHTSVQALEFWQMNALKRNFYTWKSFYTEKKQQKALNSQYRDKKLRRFWRRWRIYLDFAARKEMISLQASRFYFYSKCASAFTWWRRGATHQQHYRRLIFNQYQQTCIRLLGIILKAWRQFTAHSRTKAMQHTLARVVHEEKLLRNCMESWKEKIKLVHHHRKLLQECTERLQILTLCSCFRAWRAWSTQYRKLSSMLAILSCKCDQKTALSIFCAWKHFVQMKCRLEREAAAFEHIKTLQKGVNALRRVVQTRKAYTTNLGKAMKFILLMQNQRLAWMFLRWQQFTNWSRKKREVTLYYLQNKLLPTYWRRWVTVVRAKRHVSKRLKHAAIMWTNAILRKAWNALYVRYEVSKRKQRLLSEAELHYLAFALRSAIRKWLGTTKSSQKLKRIGRKMLTRWHLQTTYRCFVTWHEDAVRKKRIRTCVAFVLANAGQQRMVRAWFTWRKMFLIYRSGRRKCLERMWIAWKDFHTRNSALGNLQAAIETTFLKSTQKQLFQRWKDFVVQCKIRIAMMLMSSSFAHTQLVKRSFDNWRKFTAKTVIAKHRMRNVIAHMQLRWQFKMFRCLHAHTIAQKRKRSSMARVTTYYSDKLRAKFISKWREHVQVMQSQRQKLAHYLNLLQHSLQRKSFHGWQAFTTHRRILKTKLVAVFTQRAKLCSELVMSAWKVFTAQSQSKRKASVLYEVHLSRRCVGQWRKYVVLHKVEKLMGMSHQRHQEKYFLAWRKHIAMRHSIHAFKAKRERQYTFTQLLYCFHGWKNWTQLHVRCRQILGSAAMGSHLRFRFLLWKQFATQRQRLKKLAHAVFSPINISQQCIMTMDSGRNQNEAIITTGDSSNSDLREDSNEEARIAFTAHELAKKARFMQRFVIDWDDLGEVWHRWRQIFHATLFYRMRKLYICFTKWQKWSLKQRQIRWIVEKMKAHRQITSVHCVFKAWKELVRCVKQLQRQRLRERELWTIVNTEMLRKERKCLKHHWQFWKNYVEEKRHLEASLMLYRNARLVTKYWLFWQHDFMRIIREERRATALLHSKMTRFRMHRVVKRLKANQQWRKRVRLVLEYFKNKQFDSMLPVILNKWKLMVRRRQQIERNGAKRLKQQLLLVWFAWKKWVRRQRGLRRQTLIIITTREELQREASWRRWCTYVKHRHAQDELMHQATLHFVRSCVRKRWLRRIRHRQALLFRSESVIIQLQTKQLQRSIRKWKTFSHDHRLKRAYRRCVLRKHLSTWYWNVKYAIAHRFEEFLLRARVKKMLQSWRSFTKKHFYWRKLCISMQNKQDIRRIRRAWHCWRVFQHKYYQRRLALRHFKDSLTHRVWMKWCSAIESLQLVREEHFHRAECHYNQHLRRNTWRIWQIRIEYQQKKRCVVLSCVVKMLSQFQLRVLQVIWRNWMSFVNLQKKAKVLTFKHERSMRKTIIMLWRSWTMTKQRRKQQALDAENYFTKRLLSVMFFYWQNCVLAWKDVTSANKVHQENDMHRTTQALSISVSEKSDDDEHEDKRMAIRPMSPVMKRLQQKKRNVPNALEGGDVSSNYEQQNNQARVLPLEDAAVLSVSVKKRLMVLGKWKPNQKSLHSS